MSVRSEARLVTAANATEAAAPVIAMTLALVAIFGYGAVTQCQSRRL